MQDVEAICICPLVLNLVPAESSLIVTWPLPGDSAGINVGQQNAAIFNVIRIKARRSEWMVTTFLQVVSITCINFALIAFL